MVSTITVDMGYISPPQTLALENLPILPQGWIIHLSLERVVLVLMVATCSQGCHACVIITTPGCDKKALLLLQLVCKHVKWLSNMGPAVVSHPT